MWPPETAKVDAVPPLTAREFEAIRELAYRTFGLNLRTGKETLVTARLGKHIRQSGCASFDEYYRTVVQDKSGAALTRLIDALATNHTSFFREAAHFDFLRTAILPCWAERREISVWSAACSTGEEPYSIAMCLLDELGPEAFARLRILATDISTRALSHAERGIYPAERLQGVPHPRLRSYWLRGEGKWSGSYRIRKEVRDLIEFRRLNLMHSLSHAGPFPLIFCRNVMIYFDQPTQEELVQQLTRCLEPGGYLLIGHAESLGGLRHSLQHVRPAVYRKLPRGTGGAV